MTIGLRFHADTNKVYEALKRVKRAGENPKPLLQRYMGQYARKIPQRAVREQRSPEGLRPWKPLTGGHRAGMPALYDTGGLVNAFLNGRVTATNRSASMEPRPNLRRFWIHQTGGEIKPVRAKALALPLNPEARRAGSARKWWAQAKASGKKPFIFTSKRGHGLIAYRRKDGTLVLCFLLKPSVRIPKRPFLGFGGRDRQAFADMTREYLRDALGKRGSRG